MRNSLIHLLILVKTFLQAVYIIDPPIDNSRISIRCYESGENEGNIHSNFTLKMWRSLRRGGSYLIDETIPSRFIDGRQPSFNSPIIDCGNQTINKIIINKGNIEIFHSPIRCKQLTIIRFIFLDEWNQPFIENIIRKDLVDLRQLNYRYIMLCQENYSKPINIRILDKSKSDVLKVTDNFTTTKTNLSDKGIIEMIRKSYGDDGYELNESNSFITILRKFYRNNKKKLIIEYGGKLKLYEIRNDKLEKSIIEKNENLLKHIQENLQNVNNSISRNLSEIKYYTNPPIRFMENRSIISNNRKTVIFNLRKYFVITITALFIIILILMLILTRESHKKKKQLIRNLEIWSSKDLDPLTLG